ncbi:centrosomal protein of 112 kDa [Sphaeramia orbicularis]|uniref:centrosomal protein of 112 kDa n=1 Tax=Sphaeramia orbicularis TaxID=375764 RepID=UPI00117DFEFA|nr:centrosomal protein of 112 kDa-like [Sphaeramia orbicularis]
MASRPLLDFPAVVTALENLKKLDNELKEEGIRPEVRLHLTEINSAITELEANRRAAHEQLEVATIENSKLRHQCNNTTEWTHQGIMADVAAARASNAEEMEQLHNDLLATSQLQKATVKRQEALLAQNEDLRPDRDQVKAEHEDAVAALNQAITRKYSSQKHLDKIKEKVNDLKSLIAAFEQDKITLQQNTALERDSFAENIDNLSKEMVRTDKDIKLQRQETKSKRRELGRVNEKKQNANKSLEELRIEMVKTESSVQKLTTSRDQYEKQLKGEIQMYQDQNTQRETLKRELCEMSEAFLITVQQLKEDIAALENRMVVGRASRIYWQDTMAKICEVFKCQHEEETEVREKHSYTSKQLEKSKSELEERIASIVKHRQEVKQMDKLIGELVEAETINKHMFDRHQDELYGNMNTEKKRVSHYEEEKKQLGQLLEEGKRKQEEHVVKMNLDISVVRRRCEEFQQEEDTLHQHHPLSNDVVLLMNYVIQCKADCKQRETRQREEIEQCSAETERVMRSCEEKQREIEEKEEALKEVEAGWNDELCKHVGLNKLISDQREKRGDLELLIKGLKENTISLLQCKEEKEEELKAIRARCIDLFDKQVSQLQCVEMSIFNSRVKLEQVGVENSRLKLHIQQMREYMTRAGQDKDRYLQEAQQFREDTNALFESLQEAWREDLLLTQDRQSSDGDLMELMGNLLDHLKTRSHQLEHTSTLLHHQMLNFSRRLGDRTNTDQKT